MRIDIPGIKGSGELYLTVMKVLCGNTADKSMVDLGCHKAPYTSQLGFSERIYVDILDRGLDNPDEQKYFVQADMIDFLDKTTVEKFDVAISSDSIEHLSKVDGDLLLVNMEARAYKVIIFTPLGDLSVNIEAYDPDAHKSGWVPEYLPEYLSIVFPDFHPELNAGAWFGVKCGVDEQNSIYNKIKEIYAT